MMTFRRVMTNIIEGYKDNDSEDGWEWGMGAERWNDLTTGWRLLSAYARDIATFVYRNHWTSLKPKYL